MEIMIYGKGKYHRMLLDNDNYWMVRDKTLCILVTKGGIYAKVHKMTNRKLEQKLVHRLVMGEPEGMEIDHINHDTLDNRKENLRIVSHRENMRHSLSRKRKEGRTSKYKGVCLYQGKWIAQCRMKDGRNKRIGVFATEEEAARAFDCFAAREHGVEHEVLNFPVDSNHASGNG